MDLNKKYSFSFGENWMDFLKTCDDSRINIAKNSLKDFLKVKNFKGKNFLDIGCGSGLFSYTAFKLGAKKILSFDLDPLSVECCKKLRKKAGNPKNWKILHGSILDKKFFSKLGKFDIVYAWGVLHHTGKMWKAIENSAKLVKKNGYLYIAIYNKVEGKNGSMDLLKKKQRYNKSTNIEKRFIESIELAKIYYSYLRKLQNPVKQAALYKKNRGMNLYNDLKDLLGGLPYEFATIEEILQYMEKKRPDFALKNVRASSGCGNNLFLFKRAK